MSNIVSEETAFFSLLRLPLDIHDALCYIFNDALRHQLISQII